MASHSIFFSFKYLGFLYQANGDWRQAVEARMVLAKARFGKMYNIWDSSVLDLDTKLQLYESAVVSVLVYGCEGWWLTDKLLRSVNGWNSRCLSRVTGRTYREEAVAPSYNVTNKIRSRRLQWLGHVLREEETYLVRRVLLTYMQDKLDSGGYPAG